MAINQERLAWITDELTSVLLTAQTLETEFGLECENCELDGLPAPTQFSKCELKQLQRIEIGLKTALRYLREVNHAK